MKKGTEEKLAKWEKHFPGKKAKEIKTELEELRRNTSSTSSGVNIEMFGFHQAKIKELEKQLEELNLKKEKSDKEAKEAEELLVQLANARPETVGQAAERVKNEWIEAAKVGVEQGNKAIPIIGGIGGGLIGWGSGAAGFAAETSLYALNKLFKGDNEEGIKRLAASIEEIKKDRERLEEENKKLKEEKEKSQDVAGKEKLEEKIKDLEKKLKKNKDKKKEFKKEVERLRASQLQNQVEVPSKQ